MYNKDTMSIVVYWLRTDGSPAVHNFADSEMSGALKLMELHRRQGMQHVTMSTQLDGQVGKPGVDSVRDGKTPDGEVYDWSKSHRIGKMKEADRTGPVKSYVQP